MFVWASKNIYIGEFIGDEREGIGEMRWTDNSKYIGEWKKGVQNGFGRMVFPDGVMKEGYFENNVYKPSAPPVPIPTLLANPDINMTALAPKQMKLSEEVKGCIKQQGSVLLRPKAIRRSGTAEKGRSERQREELKGQNKFVERKYEKKYMQTIRKERVEELFQKRKLVGVKPRGISYTNTSARSLNRSRPDTRTINQNTMEKTFLKTQTYRNRKKKAWVPSGKVHYANEMTRRPIIFT